MTWDVLSALWKIKNWAENIGFGQGVKTFQVVYEALMDAAIQSGRPHAEGLTASMWQFALAQEGSQLALTPALMDSTHAHLCLAAGYFLFENTRTRECMRAACTPAVTGRLIERTGRQVPEHAQCHTCVRATTCTSGEALAVHLPALIFFLRAFWFSSATVPKETFVAALVAARDPGPSPAATASRPASGIAQVGLRC